MFNMNFLYGGSFETGIIPCLLHIMLRHVAFLVNHCIYGEIDRKSKATKKVVKKRQSLIDETTEEEYLAIESEKDQVENDFDFVCRSVLKIHVPTTNRISPIGRECYKFFDDENLKAVRTSHIYPQCSLHTED